MPSANSPLIRTQGVPGSPPIVDTIFRKIDGAAVFVPDLTFVGKRIDGRPTPNPNVLIQYGWALKTLGHHRVIPVMNIAFGAPTAEAMPFDMRHLRNPIQYDCPDTADEPTRQAARAALAKTLERALRDVLGSDEFKASLPKPIEPPPFPAREPLDGTGRFRRKGEPIGVLDDELPWTTQREVRLSEGPALWLRVMPSVDPGRRWSFGDLQHAASRPDGCLIMPINNGAGSYGCLRAEDGFGVWLSLPTTPGFSTRIVFAFETGEVWATDTRVLGASGVDGPGEIPLNEPAFCQALEDCAAFLSRLGIKPPYRWIAGMEGLKGRSLRVPAPPGHSVTSSTSGTCVTDVLVEEGLYQPGEPAKTALGPFFEKIYDRCGLVRPRWLDSPEMARGQQKK